MLIAMLFIGGAVVAVGYLLVPNKKPTVEPVVAARAWADRTGIRITGVSCREGRCTFGTPGQPFDAYCNAEGCTLVGCGSEQ
jgi:hypothetical protein